MRTSLRWRLFAILAVSVLFAWIATAFFTYLDTRREISGMLDERLVKTAELVLEQFNDLDDIRISSKQVRDSIGTALQVWQQEDVLLFSSASAPQERLGKKSEGFENANVNGVSYRVYSHWDTANRINVRVGEHYELRYALAESVVSHLLHPLYFAVPGLGLLIWLAVGAGLTPLSRFANEVKQRKPERLEPLKMTDTPREVLPLQEALNTLFVRLQEAREHERRFTADAAHELRTPLAAIKTQAQVAAAAKDPEQLKQSLNKVIQGADRAAHLVEQLLVLSHLDPEQSLIGLTPVKLSKVVNECVALNAPIAIRKGVDLGVNANDDGLILGDSALLSVLVRNLVDNAVRYTPAGGSVEVSINRTAAEVVLQVADTGPGIAPEERKRVMSRFYRVLGSGQQGSGLGLSIVQRIAKLHEAELAFDDGKNKQGLVVRVRFSAA